MEPSGRNRWQPVANGAAAKTAQIGEKRCRGLRPVADGEEGSTVRVRQRGFSREKIPEIGICCPS
jgi:hypothetical protein